MTSETGPGVGGSSMGAAAARVVAPAAAPAVAPFGGQGPKRGLFDDLAGMAGGAFSVLQGARAEAEAMGRAQLDAMVQRLDLVKREDLDAALEVARRAREQAEALEARVAALEARLAAKAEEAAPANDPGLAADGG